MSPQPYKRLRGTVLVVDDEQDVLDGLSRALRHSDFRIIGAAGARAGLEVLGRERVEVVMTDLRMPGMDGLEFLDIVRDRFPDVIRLILTAHPETGSAIAAVNEEEVFRYLTKPITRDQLVVTLHLAFERYAQDHETRELAAEARALHERRAQEVAAQVAALPGSAIVPAHTPRPGSVEVDPPLVEVEIIRPLSPLPRSWR